MNAVGKFFRNILLIFLALLVLILGVSYFMVYQGTKNYAVHESELITQEAQAVGLEPTLVAAVVRTESSFRADAESEVHARGLMQLMPETAQWCAEQMGISYEPTQLFDPQYNVRMGCFYLSYLIGRYQNVELALAAYNTGFVNVDQWLEQGVITRDTKSLQNIPIEETANYVVRVRSAKEMYDLFYREGLPDEKTQEHTLRLAFSNWKKALGVLTGQR